MRRVTEVFCRIGVLHQVEETLLVEAFRVACQDTICADAVLHVEKTYARARCTACGHVFENRERGWVCPTCGAAGVDGSGGDELHLLRVFGEPADPNTAS